MESAIEERVYDELIVTMLPLAWRPTGTRDKGTCYEKTARASLLKPGALISSYTVRQYDAGLFSASYGYTTEAKTAALQELLALVRIVPVWQRDQAHNLMIIADATSTNVLTYAGTHGKLGELIDEL